MTAETHNDYGYSTFLAKNALSEEMVWNIMRCLPAPVPNSIVDSVFMLAPSTIHGTGVFTARKVICGERFPMARGEVRYNLARYVNHKDTPNAIAHLGDGGELWCVMLVDLIEGEEVTMDYSDNKSKSTMAAEVSNRG